MITSRQTDEFIESYEQLKCWERADIHKAWRQELYALAKVSSCAYVEDDPGDCCPCVKFECDGYVAVAYLYSGVCRPAMCIGNEYMSIDYRTMLAVLYGYFADVNIPEHLMN